MISYHITGMKETKTKIKTKTYYNNYLKTIIVIISLIPNKVWTQK